MHICFVRILCRVDEVVYEQMRKWSLATLSARNVRNLAYTTVDETDVTVRVRSVRIDERQANIAEFRQRRAPIARIYFSTGAIQP
jgi:hypothetical protein